ncbi:hypothetical protein GGR52DRAFT_112934 [Hypoxylon sp. FL1284]|nr:hypothetical protein GGR52DRAFT_112934 [Hypoxylon sp. FL1284]
MATTYDDEVAQDLFGFSFGMLMMSIAAPIMRVVFRDYSREVKYEFWFGGAALISHVAYICTVLAALGYLPQQHVDNVDPDALSGIAKALFATATFYPVNQLCAKLGVLNFCYGLVAANRSFVRWIYVIGNIQILCSTVTLFINLFRCVPTNYAWDFNVQGHCLDRAAILAGTESVNSTLDLAIVVLAIFIVHELRIRLYTNPELPYLFALGILSGAIGYVRIAKFYLEAIPDSIGAPGRVSGRARRWLSASYGVIHKSMNYSPR